jgi:hypothetical protein
MWTIGRDSREQSERYGETRSIRGGNLAAMWTIGRDSREQSERYGETRSIRGGNLAVWCDESRIQVI